MNQKISMSPDHYRRGLDRYVQRQQEKNQAVSKEYILWMQQLEHSHPARFDDPRSREHNLEYDLLTTAWILDKARNSEVYSQNLYAAMCNNNFCKQEIWPILAGKEWGCSWRSAGGIVADMRQQGDYLDWYCSGSVRVDPANAVDPGEDNKPEIDQEKFHYYQPEGAITDEIRQDLLTLGWVPLPGGDWEQF